MAGPQMFNDPKLAVISVTDFSPGIFQYGTVSMPNLYSPRAPLGSACFAARCVNRPGVGLVPFYGYGVPTVTSAVPVGNSPAGHPWSTTATDYVNTGMGCIGGVGPGTTTSGVPGLEYTYTDLVAFAFMGKDTSGNIFSVGFRYWTTSGTPLSAGQTMWTTQKTFPVGVSFDITTQAWNGTTTAPALVMCVPGSGTNDAQIYATPDVIAHTPVFSVITVNRAILCVASSSRIAITEQTNEVMDGAGTIIQNDDIFIWTDPPGTPNFLGPQNQYNLENSTGFGAWGSVSTGELVLIRRGNGAIVVYGDAAFPTSVVKLPGVIGTGQVLQRMSICEAGAVYATETDGVYVWNGGNTSQKISGQVPDDAVFRPELEPGGWNTLGFVGCRTHHDVLNNFVFFPNNYVYDSINNSWWMCEDPAVAVYSAFAAGKTTNRFMYVEQQYAQAGSPPIWKLQSFDATKAQPSWEWTSNPIQGPPVGGEPTLQEIEICASNPTSVSATIVVTPTVPPLMASSFTNSAQSITYTIPANTNGFRQSQRCGFTEYNICVNVVGSSSSTQPGPILHEIHLGYSQTRTTGTH